METQKIANLSGDADNEFSHFAAGKWYAINDENDADYGQGNEDSTTVKFESKVIKSNFCDSSDAYILAIGDIKLCSIYEMHNSLSMNALIMLIILIL